MEIRFSFEFLQLPPSTIQGIQETIAPARAARSPQGTKKQKTLNFCVFLHIGKAFAGIIPLKFCLVGGGMNQTNTTQIFWVKQKVF